MCNSLIIVFNNFFRVLLYALSWLLFVFTILFNAPTCISFTFTFSNTQRSPHIAVENVLLFYYSLFYFVYVETAKAKKTQHTLKRHNENFAVFLLRPIFLQVFKVKYSKHFFFGVSCCSVVDVLKLVDCLNCAEIFS